MTGSQNSAFTAYTDGSAVNKIPLEARVGGFGCVILTESNEQPLSGAQVGLTSQQAEMMAVILALDHIHKLGGKTVTVFSDSAYIVNCFLQQWYEQWRLQNWFGRANVDYWKLLLELSLDSGMRVRYVHVRGHQGIQHNETADRLALAARKRLENKLLNHG